MYYQESIVFAWQFIERIFTVTKNLEAFQEMGRKVTEAEARNDIRELIFRGYRIIYLHQAQQIYILTVIHGSRNLPGMENKPWIVG